MGKTNIYQDVFNYFKENDLLHYLKYFIETNTSNSLPYHNFYHSIVVTHYVIGSMFHEMLKFKPLVIAALFHDYKHSGGKENDEWNVTTAQNGIKEFMILNNEDSNTIECVLSIIKATQYPYVTDIEKKLYFESIIRDADLMMIYQPNFFQTIIFGLAAEANVTDISIVIEKVGEFYKNSKMITPYFKAIVKDKTPVLETLALYKQLLTTN